MITDTTERKLIFKRNKGGGLRYLLTERGRRRRDISNVIASRIASEFFRIPAVVYREASVRFPDGTCVDGIVCDYIDGFRHLYSVPPKDISNPREALWQVVLLAWLGDSDRIENDGNELVTVSGLYRTLDFDFCFHAGVSVFGIPKANRLALDRFGHAEDFERIVATVGALTDSEIVAMVDAIGRAWVRGWSQELGCEFAAALIKNRERLKRTQAFATIGDGDNPWRSWWADFVTRHHQALCLPNKLAHLVRVQGTWCTIWVLFDNLSHVVKATTAKHMTGALESIVGVRLRRLVLALR